MMTDQGTVSTSISVPPRAGGRRQPSVRPATDRLSGNQSFPGQFATGVGRLPRLRAAPGRRLRARLRRRRRRQLRLRALHASADPGVPRSAIATRPANHHSRQQGRPTGLSQLYLLHDCRKSYSVRRQTRATRFLTPIVLYITVDTQCDKLATVVGHQFITKSVHLS